MTDKQRKPVLQYYHSYKGWHINKTGLVHGCKTKKSQSPYNRVRWSQKGIYCVACKELIPDDVYKHMANVIKLTGLTVGCWMPS